MDNVISLKAWEIDDRLVARFKQHAFPSLVAVWAFDPFIEKILISRLLNAGLGELELDDNSNQKSLRYFSASELSKDWFEQEFQNYDLFRGPGTYCILQSEKLKPHLKASIIEQHEKLAPNRLVLFFSSESAIINELSKSVSDSLTIKVAAPQFWETKQLLEYLARTLNVSLPGFMSDYIIESIPNVTGDFIQALKLIKLHQSTLAQTQAKLDWDEVKTLLVPTKIDQFKLARMLATKQRYQLFKELCGLSAEYEELGQFFGFLQGHVLKLLDPSYVQNKKRPSQYDREIVQSASQWSRADLMNEIKFWGDMQILAKQKSTQLISELRYKLCLEIKN